MSRFVHLYFTFPPYPRLTVDGQRAESFSPAPEVHRLYDAETVDRYVLALQQETAELQAQLDEAKQLAQAAEQKMVEAEAAQALLGRVWLTAQADIDVKLAEAERQARFILADAQRQADAHIADTRMEAQAIINEAHETIEAVFVALTRGAEPGPETARPIADIPAAGPSAPYASTPVLDLRTGTIAAGSTLGPWAALATADTAVEPLTASTGDVGAEIVELSRIERRLHTLASRATNPLASERGGDPESERSNERGRAEWPAYDPTSTDGGVVALSEAERDASDEQAAADPLSRPSEAPLEEPLAGAPGPPEGWAQTPPLTVGVDPHWSPPSATESPSLGAPLDMPDSVPPSAGPESTLQELRPLAVTTSGGAAPWAGLPPTAAWTPASAGFGPPTQWSFSRRDEVAGTNRTVALPVEASADGETFRASPTLAGWRERWRLARDGESPVDDDVLSRVHRLASLEDGTYVGELRDGPEPLTPDDERAALELLPPPAGPPVILDETVGHAVEQARFRRPLKRARG